MRAGVTVFRIDGEGARHLREEVAREFPLTILLDGEQLATLLCSPDHLEPLAAGFLFSEGILHEKSDIRDMDLDRERGIVRIETASGEGIDRDLFMKRVITTGCGRGIAFSHFADLEGWHRIESDLKISFRSIAALMKQFQGRSETWRKTHGVHSAALCDREEILLFREDIGRHNAVDKIFGHCLLEGIPLADRIILITGRVSSEILFKVAKRRIPVLVSRSAPMDLAVQLARELGMTLLGAVRGERMNIYSGEERIGHEL